MFCVEQGVAEAIRRAFEESGELAAIAELRRHYPLLANNERARDCVMAIVGWQPVSPPPRPPVH